MTICELPEKPMLELHLEQVSRDTHDTRPTFIGAPGGWGREDVLWPATSTILSHVESRVPQPTPAHTASIPHRGPGGCDSQGNLRNFLEQKMGFSE